MSQDDSSIEHLTGSERRARQEFIRGCRLGMPILLGYAPVGLAFGVLARGLGFSTFAACACSATALAGAGQFIALSVLGSTHNIATTLIATGVVNLRYLLFATTLSPRLSGVSRRALGLIGFTLTDETFAVNVADSRAGHATAASMIGVGFVSWVGWTGGTLLGAVGASALGDPTRFGADFAMPAMFAALFIALAEDRHHVLVGICAGLFVLALPLLARAGLAVPPSMYVVVAAMFTATLATLVMRDE